MGWIPRHADVLEALRGGMADGYIQVDGRLIWPSAHPGPGWHGHGWVSRGLWLLEGQGLVHRRIWRHRFLEVATGRTAIARCPDERPFLAFSAAIIVLRLWA